MRRYAYFIVTPNIAFRVIIQFLPSETNSQFWLFTIALVTGYFGTYLAQNQAQEHAGY